MAEREPKTWPQIGYDLEKVRSPWNRWNVIFVIDLQQFILVRLPVVVWNQVDFLRYPTRISRWPPRSYAYRIFEPLKSVETKNPCPVQNSDGVKSLSRKKFIEIPRLTICFNVPGEWQFTYWEGLEHLSLDYCHPLGELLDEIHDSMSDLCAVTHLIAPARCMTATRIRSFFLASAVRPSNSKTFGLQNNSGTNETIERIWNGQACYTRVGRKVW